MARKKLMSRSRQLDLEQLWAQVGELSGWETEVVIDDDGDVCLMERKPGSQMWHRRHYGSDDRMLGYLEGLLDG